MALAKHYLVILTLSNNSLDDLMKLKDITSTWGLIPEEDTVGDEDEKASLQVEVHFTSGSQAQFMGALTEATEEFEGLHVASRRVF